jgi:transcriptional regulator with XRE-family HTH domain
LRTLPQLLKARLGEDFNQADLGRKCGVGRSAVSNWVSGFATPGAALLPRLVDALGVTSSEEARELYAACSVELPPVLFGAAAEAASGATTSP